jgi:hypothetical protein
MPMTRLGRACLLADQIHDDVSRAHPDWRQIAADSAELGRIAAKAGGFASSAATRSSTAGASVVRRTEPPTRPGSGR